MRDAARASAPSPTAPGQRPRARSRWALLRDGVGVVTVAAVVGAGLSASAAPVAGPPAAPAREVASEVRVELAERQRLSAAASAYAQARHADALALARAADEAVRAADLLAGSSTAVATSRGSDEQEVLSRTRPADERGPGRLEPRSEVGLPGRATPERRSEPEDRDRRGTVRGDRTAGPRAPEPRTTEPRTTEPRTTGPGRTEPAAVTELAAELRSAQERLAGLGAGPTVPEGGHPGALVPADRAQTPAAPGATGLPTPVELEPARPEALVIDPVTPDQQTRLLLEEAAALEETAREAFALSMEVEQAATPQDEEADRAARLDALTEMADEASSAAEAVQDGPGGLAAGVPSGGLEDRWPNGQIPLDQLCAPDFAPRALLRCEAAEALEDLNEAYRADHGRDLVVVSAYRSLSDQAEVRRVRGWLAAPPGSSNHGRGIAVDLGGMGGLGQFDAPGYLWMKEHAGTFGWFHPTMMEPGGAAPPEPWHWEFAGR